MLERRLLMCWWCCAADLIQLAGMKGIEAAGGPHIPFTPGILGVHAICWVTQRRTSLSLHLRKWPVYGNLVKIV